jgi:hypothetical protein
MKPLAILLFGGGILLAVRVMFFGVRQSVGEDFRTRAWPLAIAATFAAAGASLYLLAGSGLTAVAAAGVLAVGGIAGAGALWIVRRSESAAARTPDPDEDPRYRFQGHVARIVSSLGAPGGSDTSGRISFVIDGRTHELNAHWLPGTMASAKDGAVDSEVVIEHVDGDDAFVEPWALVESRL